MMKIVALACLVAAVSATEAVDATKAASFVQMVNTDLWCHEHHLGQGAQACIKHNGCCYSEFVEDQFDGSQSMGPCHSCDAHQDEWCAMFGGETTDSCLLLGGCTYNSETGDCISAKPEVKSTVRVCLDDAADTTARENYKMCLEGIDNVYHNPRVMEGRDTEGKEVWKNSVQNGGCAELYWYEPACDPDTEGKLFLGPQADEDGLGPPTYFCVDKYGHEIPDSRKMDPLDTWNVNCDKYRKQHASYQCPNAITLTTHGGVVHVNADNNADDCTVTCNTDMDCAGEDWCCYNGCGYSCHLPVKPMAGCAGAPGNEFQTVQAAGFWEREAGCPIGRGGEDCSRIVEEDHGSQIILMCKEGFDVVPVETSTQDMALQCKHGHWETMDGRREFVDELVCDKACDPYVISGVSTIDGRNLRERDFVVTGSGFTHNSEVIISCPEEYGVIAGSDNARRFGQEKMTCDQGTWMNEYKMQQSMECSVCYDKYEWEWNDNKNGLDENGNRQGNTCIFYATRPMECNEMPEAKENCRVSCRSCLEAEEKWKNKNTQRNLDDIPEGNRKNWKRVGEWVPALKKRIVTTVTSVQVTRQLPMNQVCTDGNGSNLRKVGDECPAGYYAMA